MKYIKLTQNKETIVDDDIYDFLNTFKWSASKKRNKYYATRTEWQKGKNTSKVIKMHRLIMNPPTHMYIDHINGNSLDNRKENLRICSNKQNLRNSGIRKNPTGFKGVRKRKDLINKPFSARITIDYKEVHLGYFYTAKEAALKYNEAAIKYFGEFANLNKI